MPKVLIAEDDSTLHASLVSWLTGQGFTVELVENGPEALDRLRMFPYDAAVLDWELPGMAGVDVCRNHRAEGGKTAILFLTGRSDINDRESGLDSGADDYLTKPFHLRELSARLRALLRRSQESRSTVLAAGNLKLDPAKKLVTRNDEELKLTKREYSLLEFFMRHPNQFFSQEALLDRVWMSESEASPEALRQCVRRLRGRIETADQPALIVTVPGMGYKLQV